MSGVYRSDCASPNALVEGEDNLPEVKLDLGPAHIHLAPAVGDKAARARPPWNIQNGGTDVRGESGERPPLLLYGAAMYHAADWFCSIMNGRNFCCG